MIVIAARCAKSTSCVASVVAMLCFPCTLAPKHVRHLLRLYRVLVSGGTAPAQNSWPQRPSSPVHLPVQRLEPHVHPACSSSYSLQSPAHRLHNDPASAALVLPPGMPAAGRVTATAIAPPCVMERGMALSCRPYVTSLILGCDLVPRLNGATLATLRAELAQVDWVAGVQGRLAEHSLVQVRGAARIYASL